MITIPTIHRNKEVAGAESRRVEIRNRNESSGGLERAFDTADAILDAKKRVKDNQNTTEATDAYLDWNRKMAEKSVELHQKNGTEAIGLEDQFNEYSNQVSGEMQFTSGAARQAFSEKVKQSQNKYQIDLIQYQAAESFEAKNQSLSAVKKQISLIMKLLRPM